VAHVQGVVILRVNFSTTGIVSNVESVSGPQMLVTSASEQLMAWQFHTNAVGDQPCQSLVVIKYRILSENYDVPQIESTSKEQSHSPAGIYQISIDSYSIILSDPASTVTRKRRFLIF
jgi:hypothetical protein